MADCEKLSKCPFFNGTMKNMPAVADLMRNMYCRSEREQCARYQVSTAGIAVPEDLFPGDNLRAREILRKS